MSEVKIYTSNGERFDVDQYETNDRIADFFVGQVRLAIDSSGFRSKVIAFFRAKKGVSGRSDQFYAVYTTDSDRDFLGEFKRAVRDRIEGDLGFTLISESDTAAFDALESRRGTMGGKEPDEEDRSALELLCQRGERGEFKIPDYETGISITRAVATGSKNASIAIADSGRSSALSEYNIVLQPDQNIHQALQPIGNTTSLMADLRKDIESQLVDRKIDTIKNEVRELRQSTDMSTNELRRELKSEIPLLKESRGGTTGPESSGAGSFGNAAGAGGLDYATEDDSLVDKINNRVPLTIIAPVLLVVILTPLLIGGANCLLGEVVIVGGYVPICNDGGQPTSEFNVTPSNVNASTNETHFLIFENVNPDQNTSTFSIGFPNATDGWDVSNYSVNVTPSDANITSSNVSVERDNSVPESLVFNVSTNDTGTITANVSAEITWHKIDPDGSEEFTFVPEIDNSSLDNATVTVMSTNVSTTTPTPTDTQQGTETTPTVTPTPPPEERTPTFSVDPGEVEASTNVNHSLVFENVTVGQSLPSSNFSIDFPNVMDGWNISSYSVDVNGNEAGDLNHSNVSVERNNGVPERLVFNVSTNDTRTITANVSAEITWHGVGPGGSEDFTFVPNIDNAADTDLDNTTVKVKNESATESRTERLSFSTPASVSAISEQGVAPLHRVQVSDQYGPV